MTEFNYRRYESEVQYMKIKGRTFTYVVRKAEEEGSLLGASNCHRFTQREKL